MTDMKQSILEYLEQKNRVGELWDIQHHATSKWRSADQELDEQRKKLLEWVNKETPRRLISRPEGGHVLLDWRDASKPEMQVAITVFNAEGDEVA